MLSKKHGPSTYKYVRHKQLTCRRSHHIKPNHQKKHICHNQNYIANQIKYNKHEKAIKHKYPVDITPVIEQIIEQFVEQIIESVVESSVEPIVEPIVNPVVESSVGPIVEPIVNPVVESSVRPIIEPTQEIKDIQVKKKRSYMVRKVKKSWKWLKSWIYDD